MSATDITTHRNFKAYGAALERGTQPPDDGDMEQRLAKLEDTMTTVRERLATIEERVNHTATKDQVESLRSDLIKWFVGTALILASIAFTAAKLIH